MNRNANARRSAGLRIVLLGAAAGIIGLLIVEAVLIPWLVVPHRHPLPLEKAAGYAAIALAAKLHGGSRQNPSAQDPAAVAAGQAAFRSCIVCHGSQADGKGLLSKGLYPAPANLLAGSARELSDAQLFWIIKNGVGYTAMPSYGGQLSDKEIWSLVSYIRSLQRKQTLSGDGSPGARA